MNELVERVQAELRAAEEELAVHLLASERAEEEYRRAVEPHWRAQSRVRRLERALKALTED